MAKFKDIFPNKKLYVEDAGEICVDNIGLRDEANRKLLENRTILLSSEINQYDATTIAGLFLVLNAENSKKPITLIINSPGGAIEGFLAIYDMMQLVEAPIKTVVLGDASSAAAMLAAAGSKGLRYSTQNAYIMIHQIQLGAGSGSTTEVEMEMKACKKINKRVLEILARHVEKPYRKVQRDCKQDKYMTAEEALEYGIIDEIIKPTKFIPKLKPNPRKTKKEKLEEKRLLENEKAE